MMNNFKPFWNYFNNLEIQKSLLADKKRMEAYQQAIKLKIKKGDIVVDLGAGLGIFSLMALKQGAAKVYAIEAMPIIEKAKEIARQNGVRERIEFIQNSSKNVILPQKADVLISEILGELGIDEDILCFTSDSYRFMKEKFKMIPNKLDLFLVPFESQEFFSHYVSFWENKMLGFEFGSLKKGYHLFPIQSDFDYIHRFLGEPINFASIDLHKITQKQVNARINFKVLSEGIVHGFLGYFNAQLARGVSIENSPKAQMSCWRNLCFPVVINGSGLHVQRYDELSVEISSRNTSDVVEWQLKLV